MNQTDFYKQSYEALKDACDTYKAINSTELYHASLLELVRYAVLAGLEKQAFAHACEAIDHDPLYSVILLEDEDYCAIRGALTDEILKRTKANQQACKDIRQKMENLYMPSKKDRKEFSEQLEKADGLLQTNAFFDSIHALKLLRELEKAAEDRKLVSNEEQLHIVQDDRRSQELSAAIKRVQERKRKAKEKQDRQLALEQEALERRLAEEKAEQERRERERKVEEERQRKQTEERERQQRESRENQRRQKELTERREAMIKKVSLIGVIVAVVAIISIILIVNRVRYINLDQQSFLEQLDRPDDRFTYTYFLYDDKDIVMVKSLPGREIKVPGNDFEITKHMVREWTTTIPDSTIASFDSIIDRVPVSQEQKVLQLSDIIQVGSKDMFYFANWTVATHSIHFHGNGAKGVDSIEYVPYGAQYVFPSPKKPVQDNLTFLGWSVSRIGDPEEAVRPGTTLVMPDFDVMFYALWEPTDGIYFNIVWHLLSIPAIIPIFCAQAFAESLIVFRIILLVFGFIGFVLAAVIYGNDHKIIGTIFLLGGLGTFLWAVAPNLYLAMLAIF